MNFKHLKELDETYFKHAKCASLYSMLFLGLSIVNMIHAIFPFVFCTTVSDKLEEMQEHLEERKCKM
jgi:hypothetical protein